VELIISIQTLSFRRTYTQDLYIIHDKSAPLCSAAAGHWIQSRTSGFMVKVVLWNVDIAARILDSLHPTLVFPKTSASLRNVPRQKSMRSMKKDKRIFLSSSLERNCKIFIKYKDLSIFNLYILHRVWQEIILVLISIKIHYIGNKIFSYVSKSIWWKYFDGRFGFSIENYPETSSYVLVKSCKLMLSIVSHLKGEYSFITKILGQLQINEKECSNSTFKFSTGANNMLDYCDH